MSPRQCCAFACFTLLLCAAWVCLVIAVDASGGQERRDELERDDEHVRGDGHMRMHNTVGRTQHSRHVDVTSPRRLAGSLQSPQPLPPPPPWLSPRPPPATAAPLLTSPSPQPLHQDVLPGALTRRAFRFSQAHATATPFVPDAADALGAAIAILATTADEAPSGGEAVFVGCDFSKTASELVTLPRDEEEHGQSP